MSKAHKDDQCEKEKCNADSQEAELTDFLQLQAEKVSSNENEDVEEDVSEFRHHVGHSCTCAMQSWWCTWQNQP